MYVSHLNVIEFLSFYLRIALLLGSLARLCYYRRAQARIEAETEAEVEAQAQS